MGISDLKWPGPRPLGPKDTLVGRERELGELFSVCRSHDVIEITALSGVGKTSFVRASLIPKLEEAGAIVPPPIAWPRAAAILEALPVGDHAGSPGELLYRIAIGSDPRDARPVGEVLQGLRGQTSAVVVLDQFEELLRYHRGVAEQLLRTAGLTARDTGVPHIVIARSEYRERLRPVEVRGAQVWSLSLGEIDDPETLRAIVDVPAAEAGVRIAPGARDRLIDWWLKARDSIAESRARRMGTEGLAEIGLLQFQALLWSFKRHVARDGVGEEIEEADVLSYERARSMARRSDSSTEHGADSGADAVWLLEDALVSYVAVNAARLAAPLELRVAEASRPVRWVNGPRLLLARVAPTLSAGGFKQPQALYSLLPNALGDELTQRGARKLASRLKSRQPGTDRASITADFEVKPAGAAHHWKGEVDLVNDMIDALHAALQAMSDPEVNILREFDRADEPIYELVHDGMGTALERWASDFLDEPLATIGVVASQAGGLIDCDLTAEMFESETAPPELWGDVQRRTAALGARASMGHLRWPAAVIKGIEIRDILFEHGDFSGAAFLECSLHNVAFRDCNLNGAIMIGCSLEKVTFEIGTSLENDRGDGFNMFTVLNPRPAADVRFVGLRRTSGLSLQGVAGGRWLFQDSHVAHLMVTSVEATALEFVASRVAPVSLDAGIYLESDSASRIVTAATI